MGQCRGFFGRASCEQVVGVLLLGSRSADIGGRKRGKGKGEKEGGDVTGL